MTDRMCEFERCLEHHLRCETASVSAAVGEQATMQYAQPHLASHLYLVLRMSYFNTKPYSKATLCTST